MQLSLIAAISENNVIGLENDIPWKASGEQLLFKAMTYNSWIILGRKTFEGMGVLPHRKYAVLSKTQKPLSSENIRWFTSMSSAVLELQKITDQVFICGGETVYALSISSASYLHITRVHTTVDGDKYFPPIPTSFNIIFEQTFKSNIDYTYQIWKQAE